MYKKLLIFLFVLSTSFLFGEDSMLYIIHSKEGRYDNGILRLKQVSERVTYFTKAPHRRAGVIELEAFLPQLSKQKETRGHLVYHQETSEPFHDIVITVSDPKLQGETLRAKVQAVPPAKIPENQTLDSVTLLFDLSKP